MLRVFLFFFFKGKQKKKKIKLLYIIFFFLSLSGTATDDDAFGYVHQNKEVFGNIVLITLFVFFKNICTWIKKKYKNMCNII